MKQQKLFLRARVLCSLSLAALLSACILVPVTTEVYDAECHISSKHMDLQALQIGRFNHCHNQECTALLVGAGATAAASAVISGSIVIVGNVVYWLEKQGRCQRQ